MSKVFRPKQLLSYDDESILSEIRRVIANHFQGSCPRRDDFDKYSRVKSQTIRQHFGSWEQGVKKAGFEYKGKINYENRDLSRANYTKDLMIADLERIKSLNDGQYFSQSYYSSNGGKYSVKTLKAHFNCTWASLLKEYLLLVPIVTVRRKIHHPKPQRVSCYSKQSLFEELKRVWEELGRRPSYSEFKERGRIGVKVYERRFGNWKSAIASFYAQTDQGSVNLVGSHVTSDLLLEELRRFSHESRHGQLTYDDYRTAGGTYSIGTFQNHFGSWQKAVEKVGFLDGHSSKFEDEDLFIEIQRLWEMYGRQPTFKDMNKDGKISGGVFQRKFGSWMKAIHAFCDDRNSTEEDDDQEIVAQQETPPVLNTTIAQQSPEIRTPAHATSQELSNVAVPPENTILVDRRRVPGKRLRWQILERDSFRCVACGRGKKNYPDIELHVDHIIPWASGGLTVYDNLQTLCVDCNLGKSDRLGQ